MITLTMAHTLHLRLSWIDTNKQRMQIISCKTLHQVGKVAIAVVVVAAAVVAIGLKAIRRILSVAHPRKKITKGEKAIPSISRKESTFCRNLYT